MREAPGQEHVGGIKRTGINGRLSTSLRPASPYKYRPPFTGRGSKGNFLLATHIESLIGKSYSLSCLTPPSKYFSKYLHLITSVTQYGYSHSDTPVSVTVFFETVTNSTICHGSMNRGKNINVRHGYSTKP